MSHQDPDVATIVEKLKEKAWVRPWVPLGIPPREHYHVFPNGLSICFTLDVLLDIRFWHLSIARVPGGVAPDEVDFWRHAFFDKTPDIESLSPISFVAGRHFYWRAE